MGYYTPYVKSSYITGGLRRQTVEDFLAAVAFVDKFKKFDQLYVFEQEKKEINDQEWTIPVPNLHLQESV